ncbi:MAG: hypothetical protein IAE89_12530 [Anaerolineae bacterium]|nr:hypothetical protein [Anaerolineae bacterium]
MKTRITSRNVILAIPALMTTAVGLELLIVISQQGISERTLSACLFVMSFFIFTIGGVLFTGRAFLGWQIEEISSHLIWERGCVITAIVTLTLGLALLEDMLHSTGTSTLALLGMVAFLLGTVVIMVAETTSISKFDWNYSQVVLYVVLAFLAQAAIGAALLQTTLVAGWVGWLTIVWNLAWLVLLLIFSRRNIYFPILHHVAPLIIGIALLAG